MREKNPSSHAHTHIFVQSRAQINILCIFTIIIHSVRSINAKMFYYYFLSTLHIQMRIARPFHRLFATFRYKLKFFFFFFLLSKTKERTDRSFARNKGNETNTNNARMQRTEQSILNACFKLRTGSFTKHFFLTSMRMCARVWILVFVAVQYIRSVLILSLAFLSLSPFQLSVGSKSINN